MRKTKTFISVLIVFTIIISSLSACGKSVENNASGKDLLVYSPVIPTQAQCPKDDGNFDYEKYMEQYNAWNNDRMERLNQENGYEDSYRYFLANSLPALMKDSKTNNKVCSPVNIYLALAMLCEITDGNSQKEILNALGCESVDSLRNQAKAVWISSNCDDGVVTSQLSSSIWLSDKREYNTDTINKIVDNYFASVYCGDVCSDKYTQELRNWINDHTGNLLKDSTEDIKLDKDTLIAIITAVYYEAAWDEPFEEYNTNSNIFCGLNGEQNVDFMNSTESSYFYQTDEFDATSKSLQNGNRMVFIKPSDGQSVDSVLESNGLVEFLFDTSGSNKEIKSVLLSVPKFDVKSEIDLIPVLKELGISDVFDVKKSDFSPLVSGDNPVVDVVKHASRVMIDEEGCVAAAFTEIMVKDTAIMIEQPIEFKLDKPFIFAIIGDNNIPLFVGTVESI